MGSKGDIGRDGKAPRETWQPMLLRFAFNLDQIESEPRQAQRWAYGDFAFDPVYRIKSKMLCQAA